MRFDTVDEAEGHVNIGRRLRKKAEALSNRAVLLFIDVNAVGCSTHGTAMTPLSMK
jgi:hypothetical protein